MRHRSLRPLLALFCAQLVLAACSSGSGASSGASGASSAATVMVTKVTDGDTFHAQYMGRDERIRLIGVNTPEVSWYGGTAECFGDQAGDYARSRLDRQSVRLAFDKDLRDRYGRLLAYVYLGNELINLTLVQQGYARADPVPPDTAMASQFAEAETQARAAGLGLWSECQQGGELGLRL